MMGLSGCEEIPSNVASRPTICTPESPTVNIYRATPQSWANMIFEYAFPIIPTPIPPNAPVPLQFNEPQIFAARYASFQFLLNETKRWSDTETITLDDSNKTRITVTFINPDLLQAVFLSDVLRNRSITSNFQSQLQAVLNTIAERDELLFLLTVTTTNNNTNAARHTIKIPIDNMVLNNAESLIISPSHDDHNLEQLIDTSSDSVFGYLAYPLTVLSESQCKWVLDPKYNTNIVITVPFIEVDGARNNNSYSWTIPYVSLIKPITPSDPPEFAIPPGFDLGLMTPSATPPTEINQVDYWQNFARFIWNQVTLGNY